MPSFFLSVSFFLVTLSFSGEEVSDRADLIFFGGDILTINEASPTAEAVAVRRGKILAVGKKSDILKWKGDKTEIIDLKGGTLLPGFIGFKPFSEQFEKDAKEVAIGYAKDGYTTITDLSLEDAIDPLKEVAHSENAPIRLQGYVVSDEMKNIASLQKENDDRFRVLGVKIWADETKLDPLVSEARRLGLQISIRANSGEEVERSIVALENALQQHPKDDHRFRIEHAEIANEQSLKKMISLKIAPSVTNQHLYCWGTGCKDRTDQVDVAGTAKKLGMKFTLSDASPTTTISPLLMLEVVATRKALGSGTFNQVNGISVEDAIKAMTLFAAEQTFRDKELGSIIAGKQADFVVLSQNPKDVEPRKIKDIEVQSTWINGKKVIL